MPRTPPSSASSVEQGERHLRDFLKHTRYLIQSTDMQGRLLLFVNQTWRDVLGYREEDIARGLTMHTLLAPEARNVGIRQLESVFACTDTAGTSVVELSLMTRDGRRVTVNGEIDCRIVDGEPVATRAIFRDVSVQRRAEAEARQTEAQYHAVVNVLHEGIAIVDAQGFSARIP